MAEGWMAVVFLLLVCVAARMKNREAAKQDGGGSVRFRFGIVKKPFRKESEGLYTQDRKINREWKR